MISLIWNHKQWRRICAATLIVGCAGSTTAANSPYVPESANAIVLVRDYPVLAQQHVKVEADIPALLRQVRTLVSHGLRQGDSHSLGLAHGLLQRSKAAMNTAEGLYFSALIAQQQHQFETALERLQRALKKRPETTEAYLAMAAIYLAQGNFKDASTACQATMLKTDPLVTLNCIAQSEGPRNDTARMQERLDELLLWQQNLAPELESQLLTTLGDLALWQNQLPQAADYYAKAIRLQPQLPYLLAQLGELALDLKRPDLLEPWLHSREQELLPLLFRTALGQSMNSPDSNAQKQRLKRRLNALSQESAADSDKLWALFFRYVEPNPKRALHHAALNWQRQKSLPDTRLYEQSARAADNLEALRTIAQWRRQQGLPAEHSTPALVSTDCSSAHASPRNPSNQDCLTTR